jgi:lysozyme family protein
MYPEIFNKCILVLLGNGVTNFGLEGGYSNKKSDKGGETKFGISKRSYPNINIKTLTRDRAIEIYYNDFWLPMKLDGILIDGLILHLFVIGVNSGIRTAIKILQRLVGVDDDGLIGSDTLRAIREFNGDIVDAFRKREKLFYITLAQKKLEERDNLEGWLNRVDKTIFTA